MSVLIKGMEMPYNCWDCSLLNASSCPCKNYSSALEYTTNRHPDCPLTEVQEPHGRLIDADALMKRMWEETDCMISVPATFVRDAPTVIPASEEGEA